MKRWFDVAGLMLLGALAVISVGAAEIAGLQDHFAEATFRLLHGLIFLGLFVAVRWFLNAR